MGCLGEGCNPMAHKDLANPLGRGGGVISRNSLWGRGLGLPGLVRFQTGANFLL